jgi:hypothetical protein
VKDAGIKRSIREAAEAEERDSYEHPDARGLAGSAGSFGHGLAEAVPRNGAVPDRRLSN